MLQADIRHVRKFNGSRVLKMLVLQERVTFDVVFFDRVIHRTFELPFSTRFICCCYGSRTFLRQVFFATRGAARGGGGTPAVTGSRQRFGPTN